jgi:bifunctional UDP-N-acetylglucosamine pyrophosphorylase / glucosamine-1-phosphate N-acetyltransferase
MQKSQIIILAAGRGSRIGSELPKVMHKIAGKTMLDMVLENSVGVTDNITIVYSKKLIPYLNGYPNKIKFVLQNEPLGTGHAVYCALSSIRYDGYVVVLCGDNPFIRSDIILNMLNECERHRHSLMVMACERTDPSGYGRLIVDNEGCVQQIIECRDADKQQKTITLCNSGIIIAKASVLNYLVSRLVEYKQSTNGEYYLTSIIEMGYHYGHKAAYFIASNDIVMGVNTLEELAIANKIVAKNESV